MDARTIVVMHTETVGALRAAVKLGAAAAFTEAEQAETAAWLAEHPGSYQVVRVAADGTITATEQLVEEER